MKSNSKRAGVKTIEYDQSGGPGPVPVRDTVGSADHAVDTTRDGCIMGPTGCNRAAGGERRMTDLENADQIQLLLTVSDMESVYDVLVQLADIEATVEPQGLSVADPDDEWPIETDIGDLTSKQLEALELAYSRGYYRQPRETDLTALAEELDVSKSAVSQRLRAAESKLVIAIFASIRPWLVQSESA